MTYLSQIRPLSRYAEGFRTRMAVNALLHCRLPNGGRSDYQTDPAFHAAANSETQTSLGANRSRYCDNSGNGALCAGVHDSRASSWERGNVMRARIMFTAIVLASASIGANAFADPGQSDGAAQPAGSDPNQIVCKTTSAPVGSRLGGGRVCLPRHEWDDRTKQAQDALVHQQLSGRTSCVGSAAKSC